MILVGATAIVARAPHVAPTVTDCVGGEAKTEFYTPGVRIQYTYTDAEYSACVKYDPNTDQCHPRLRFSGYGGHYPTPYRISFEGQWESANDHGGIQGSILVQEGHFHEGPHIRWDSDEEMDWGWYDPPTVANVSLSFMRQEVDETRKALDDYAKLDKGVEVDCPTDADSWGGNDHKSQSDTLLRRCLPAVGCYHVQ